MRLTAIQPEKKSIQDLYEDFYNFKKAEGKSARTLLDYTKIIPKFIKASNNSLDFSILTKDIVNYFAAIPDTSPARYNHPYEYLNAMFNFGVRMEYLEKNPISALGLQKKRDEGHIKSASIEDIKKLLSLYDLTEYSGYRTYCMILLMLDTGIRTSEIVKLKNSDFDFDSRQLIIRKEIAKTRRTRTVFVSDETAKMIRKIIKIKPIEWGDTLFPSRDGNILDTHVLSVDFSRKCASAGIKITPYQLRHSFASYMAKSGCSIFSLQQLMGHSDIRMTKRYVDMDKDTLRLSHEKNTPVNLLISNSIRLRKKGLGT